MKRSVQNRLASALTLLCLLSAKTTAAEIANIGQFLDQCPTNDPAFAQITTDFTIRRNGVPVTEFPCTEPVSQMPIAEYTDELVLLQGLRVAFYMDQGQSGHLPWTPGTLYEWMSSKLGGFTIDDDAVFAACCVSLDDGTYVILPARDDFNREFDRQWRGISGYIALYAHETRHVDGFSHTSCCGISGGCDQTYDESNLSPYGIQWWLNKVWLSGDIYVGFSCLSDASSIAWWLLSGVNNFASRFCDDSPPQLSTPEFPGGPCCGDGEVLGDEVCDDGNTEDGDSCCADCTLGCFDDFLCYRVTRTRGAPKFHRRDVLLTDQFESRNTTVVKPAFLCTPADKNGEGLADPRTHLESYKIKTVRGQGKTEKHRVRVTDQFGTLVLDTRKPKQLMVPTSKHVVRAFSIPELPDPDTNINGLAFHGGSLFALNTFHDPRTNSNAATIYELNPLDGTIRNAFSAPFGGGLASDGTYLYVNTFAPKEGHIVKLDPATGAVLATIQPSGVTITGGAGGLAFLNGSLFQVAATAECGGVSIIRLDPAEGTFVDCFNVDALGIERRELASDGANLLYGSAEETFGLPGSAEFKVFTLSTAGGVLRTDTALSLSTDVNGMACGDGELFVADRSRGDIVSIFPCPLGGAPPDPSKHDVDHFKCYDVKRAAGEARFLAREVTISDQFGLRQVFVKKPKRLCVPVNKDDEGIKNPARHRICYRAKASPSTTVPGIRLANQFGAAMMDVQGEVELCLPAEKIVE